MLNHLTIACLPIIGQSSGNVSPHLARFLGALRAPEFLPRGASALLFETHAAYWLLLAVLAGTLFYVGRSRPDRRMKIAGLAGIGLLIVWMLAAALVETPRERLYAAHTGLAQAAKDGDADRILSYLAPDFRAPALGLDHSDLGRERLRLLLKDNQIKDNIITGYHSDISGRAAFTALSLITQTDAGGPVATTWNLSWDDIAGEDWKIKEADLRKLGDQAISGEGGLSRSVSGALLK